MILIYNPILGLRYTILLDNLRASKVVNSIHLYNSGIALNPHKIMNLYPCSRIKYYKEYDTYANAPADRAESHMV